MRAAAVTAVLGWTGECWGLAGSGGVPASPRTSRRRKRIPGRCGPGSESARLHSDPFAVLPFTGLGKFAPLPRPGSRDPAVCEEERAAGAGGTAGDSPSVSCLSLSQHRLGVGGGPRGLGTEPAGEQTGEGTGDRCWGISFLGHWIVREAQIWGRLSEIRSTGDLPGHP